MSEMALVRSLQAVLLLYEMLKIEHRVERILLSPISMQLTVSYTAR